MYSPLNSIVIILAQNVTSVFLATLVIWTPFSPLMSVFSYSPMNKNNRSALSIICQTLKDADEENYFLDLLTLSCKDVDASSKELHLSYNK